MSRDAVCVGDGLGDQAVRVGAAGRAAGRGVVARHVHLLHAVGQLHAVQARGVLWQVGPGVGPGVAAQRLVRGTVAIVRGQRERAAVRLFGHQLHRNGRGALAVAVVLVFPLLRHLHADAGHLVLVRGGEVVAVVALLRHVAQDIVGPAVGLGRADDASRGDLLHGILDQLAHLAALVLGEVRERDDIGVLLDFVAARSGRGDGEGVVFRRNIAPGLFALIRDGGDLLQLHEAGVGLLTADSHSPRDGPDAVLVAAVVPGLGEDDRHLLGIAAVLHVDGEMAVLSAHGRDRDLGGIAQAVRARAEGFLPALFAIQGRGEVLRHGVIDGGVVIIAGQLFPGGRPFRRIRCAQPPAQRFAREGRGEDHVAPAGILGGQRDVHEVDAVPVPQAVAVVLVVPFLAHGHIGGHIGVGDGKVAAKARLRLRDGIGRGVCGADRAPIAQRHVQLLDGIHDPPAHLAVLEHGQVGPGVRPGIRRGIGVQRDLGALAVRELNRLAVSQQPHGHGGRLLEAVRRVRVVPHFGRADAHRGRLVGVGDGIAVLGAAGHGAERVIAERRWIDGLGEGVIDPLTVQILGQAGVHHRLRRAAARGALRRRGLTHRIDFRAVRFFDAGHVLIAHLRPGHGERDVPAAAVAVVVVVPDLGDPHAARVVGVGKRGGAVQLRGLTVDLLRDGERVRVPDIGHVEVHLRLVGIVGHAQDLGLGHHFLDGEVVFAMEGALRLVVFQRLVEVHQVGHVKLRRGEDIALAVRVLYGADGDGDVPALVVLHLLAILIQLEGEAVRSLDGAARQLLGDRDREPLVEVQPVHQVLALRGRGVDIRRLDGDTVPVAIEPFKAALAVPVAAGGLGGIVHPGVVFADGALGDALQREGVEAIGVRAVARQLHHVVHRLDGVEGRAGRGLERALVGGDRIGQHKGVVHGPVRLLAVDLHGKGAVGGPGHGPDVLRRVLGVDPGLAEVELGQAHLILVGDLHGRGIVSAVLRRDGDLGPLALGLVAVGLDGRREGIVCHRGAVQLPNLIHAQRDIVEGDRRAVSDGMGVGVVLARDLVQIAVPVQVLAAVPQGELEFLGVRVGFRQAQDLLGDGQPALFLDRGVGDGDGLDLVFVRHRVGGRIARQGALDGEVMVFQERAAVLLDALHQAVLIRPLAGRVPLQDLQAYPLGALLRGERRQGLGRAGVGDVLRRAVQVHVHHVIVGRGVSRRPLLVDLHGDQRVQLVGEGDAAVRAAVRRHGFGHPNRPARLALLHGGVGRLIAVLCLGGLQGGDVDVEVLAHIVAADVHGVGAVAQPIGGRGFRHAPDIGLAGGGVVAGQVFHLRRPGLVLRAVQRDGQVGAVRLIGLAVGIEREGHGLARQLFRQLVVAPGLVNAQGRRLLLIGVGVKHVDLHLVVGRDLKGRFRSPMGLLAVGDRLRLHRRGVRVVRDIRVLLGDGIAAGLEIVLGNDQHVFLLVHRRAGHVHVQQLHLLEVAVLEGLAVDDRAVVFAHDLKLDVLLLVVLDGVGGVHKLLAQQQADVAGGVGDGEDAVVAVDVVLPVVLLGDGEQPGVILLGVEQRAAILPGLGGRDHLLQVILLVQPQGLAIAGLAEHDLGVARFIGHKVDEVARMVVLRGGIAQVRQVFVDAGVCAVRALPVGHRGLAVGALLEQLEHRSLQGMVEVVVGILEHAHAVGRGGAGMVAAEGLGLGGLGGIALDGRLVGERHLVAGIAHQPARIGDGDLRLVRQPEGAHVAVEGVFDLLPCGRSVGLQSDDHVLEVDGQRLGILVLHQIARAPVHGQLVGVDDDSIAGALGCGIVGHDLVDGLEVHVHGHLARVEGLAVGDGPRSPVGEGAGRIGARVFDDGLPRQCLQRRLVLDHQVIGQLVFAAVGSLGAVLIVLREIGLVDGEREGVARRVVGDIGVDGVVLGHQRPQLVGVGGGEAQARQLLCRQPAQVGVVGVHDPDLAVRVEHAVLDARQREGVLDDGQVIAGGRLAPVQIARVVARLEEAGVRRDRLGGVLGHLAVQHQAHLVHVRLLVLAQLAEDDGVDPLGVVLRPVGHGDGSVIVLAGALQALGLPLVRIGLVEAQHEAGVRGGGDPPLFPLAEAHDLDGMVRDDVVVLRGVEMGRVLRGIDQLVRVGPSADGHIGQRVLDHGAAQREAGAGKADLPLGIAVHGLQALLVHLQRGRFIPAEDDGAVRGGAGLGLLHHVANVVGDVQAGVHQGPVGDGVFVVLLRVEAVVRFPRDRPAPGGVLNLHAAIALVDAAFGDGELAEQLRPGAAQNLSGFSVRIGGDHAEFPAEIVTHRVHGAGVDGVFQRGALHVHVALVVVDDRPLNRLGAAVRGNAGRAGRLPERQVVVDVRELGLGGIQLHVPVAIHGLDRVFGQGRILALARVEQLLVVGEFGVVGQGDALVLGQLLQRHREALAVLVLLKGLVGRRGFLALGGLRRRRVRRIGILHAHAGSGVAFLGLDIAQHAVPDQLVHDPEVFGVAARGGDGDGILHQVRGNVLAVHVIDHGLGDLRDPGAVAVVRAEAAHDGVAEMHLVRQLGDPAGEVEGDGGAGRGLQQLAVIADLIPLKHDARLAVRAIHRVV